MRARRNFRIGLIGVVALLLTVGCGEDEITSPTTNPESPAISAAINADAALSPGTASYGSAAMAIHPIEQTSSGEGQVIGWCNESAGVVLLTAPGTGTLTHTGRFDLQQTMCLDSATGAITGGLGTLTAANDDEIYLEFSGRVLPGVAPQTLDLDYVVVGGTGRFGAAEGELNAAVVYTSATTWVSEGAGWIRYDASERSSR
jgi:hypothetical protein